MNRDDALFLLDSCLFRIRRAQSSRRAARIQANLSGDWLSPTSLAILTELEGTGPVRMKSLADLVQADLSRTSRQVHDLAARGYVEVAPDEADGRAVVVHLTKLGLAQRAAYHDEVRRMLADRLDDWKDADIARFSKLFDRFLTTLGPRPEEAGDAPTERPTPASLAKPRRARK